MSNKILVTRSSMPPYEEYIEEIKELWETRWLTNSGAKHVELEKRLCEYLSTSNMALCTNGHLALECILEVFDFEPGSEVITTPFTFVSTTNSIVRKGLVPVFCDINDQDFTMDVTKIESLITDKTCAIMPVHVYGNVCDNDAIMAIAKKYNLKVIYDSAHAFGVKKDGVAVAQLGDASMFSFHATKVFHTIEGGGATFADAENYSKLNQWKNFGINSNGNLDMAGGNAKMNEFAAAMGLCNLRHIEDAIASRGIASRKYRELLENVEGLQLSIVQEGVESNYAYFPIVVHPEVFGCTREDIVEALEKEGIGARKYFFPLTNTVGTFNGRYSTEDTPVAARISENVLCLPLYEGLAEEDVERICNIIKQLRGE